MSIQTWIIGKFAKPVLPILQQTYKVTVAVEDAIIEILKNLVVGSPAYVKADSVLDAVMVVKDAIFKIITFLGGSVMASYAASNLQDEIDKLKKLL